MVTYITVYFLLRPVPRMILVIIISVFLQCEYFSSRNFHMHYALCSMAGLFITIVSHTVCVYGAV